MWLLRRQNENYYWAGGDLEGSLSFCRRFNDIFYHSLGLHLKTNVFSNQARHESFTQYQFNQSHICCCFFCYSVQKTSFRIPLCSGSVNEKDTNKNHCPDEITQPAPGGVVSLTEGCKVGSLAVPRKHSKALLQGSLNRTSVYQDHH